MSGVLLWVCVDPACGQLLGGRWKGTSGQEPRPPVSLQMCTLLACAHAHPTLAAPWPCCTPGAGLVLQTAPPLKGLTSKTCSLARPWEVLLSSHTHSGLGFLCWEAQQGRKISGQCNGVRALEDALGWGALQHLGPVTPGSG